MRVLAIASACFFMLVTSFNVRRPPEVAAIEKILFGLESELARRQDVKSEAEESDDDDVKPNLKAMKSASYAKIIKSEDENLPVPADIALSIHPNGMKNVFEQLLLSIRHDIMHQHIADIETSYIGMNLKIDNIQIVDFIVPKMHMESISQSKLRFSTSGGSVKLRGLYTASYKTTRTGQFEALLDDIQIVLMVELSITNGKIQINSMNCSNSVGDISVNLTPVLPIQIVQHMRDVIEELLDEKTCTSVEKYVQKAVKIAEGLVGIEDTIATKNGDNSFVNHDLTGSHVENKGAHLEFTKSRKEVPEADAASAKIHTHEPSTEMATVSVRESYVNDILDDLAKRGDIVFHIHKIPQIKKALRMNCDPDEECLGHYVQLKGIVDGSGHLDSKLTDSPRVEFHDNFATVYLSLSTKLSFENAATGHRITYLRFRTDLRLRINKLSFEPSDTGYYGWSADYVIEDNKISHVHSDYDEMDLAIQEIENFLSKKQPVIEEMLSNYLNGDLPLHIHPHIRLAPMTATFKSGRAQVSGSFRVDRRIFPSLEILS